MITDSTNRHPYFQIIIMQGTNTLAYFNPKLASFMSLAPTSVNVIFVMVEKSHFGRNVFCDNNDNECPVSRFERM
jgi:hypothetical protein